MTEERKYWEPDIETMPLDKLRELQVQRLQKIVTRAYEKTKLYRRKFDQAGVKPSDIKALDDLRKLPLTEYLTDFCQTPLEDKMAIPMSKVKQVCSTSGTVSGFTQPVPLSEGDFRTQCVNALARFRWAAGERPNDVIQCLLPWNCQLVAIRALGAGILLEQTGRGKLDNQIKLAKIMGVTVLEQMASLVLSYFERAKELGIDIRETKLRLIFSVGEGWAESYKKKVEAVYGTPFRSFYGVTEAGELAYECEYGGGMHIAADLCIIEVIDPETKQVLGPGEEGELVVTNLIREAIPVIRYRVGDIAKILPYEPCLCGRTLPKMSMVKGRISQLVNVKGRKLFPMDVEEIVGNIPDLGHEYQIILDRPGEQEKLKVRVEYAPEVKKLTNLRKRVEEELNQSLGVESEVELVPVGSIGRALFKAQRVVAN